MAKYVNIEELYTFIDNQGHVTIDDLNGVEDFVDLPSNFREVAQYCGREVWQLYKNKTEPNAMKKVQLVEAGFDPHGYFRYVVRGSKNEDQTWYIPYAYKGQKICLTEEEAKLTLAEWELEKLANRTRSCDKLRCVGNCHGKCCVEKCDGSVSALEPGTNDNLEDAAKLYAGVKQYLAEMLGR